MCRAFDLNLSFSELKTLDPDFVNIDDACLVCSKGDYTKDNLIIYCDKCNCMVHQKCYDLKVIPEGKWFCYKCEVFDREHLNLIKCTMCQQYGGIMKPSAYPAKSSIYEAIQKERRNSYGAKQEDLDTDRILQIEREHYANSKKNIEIYGKFQSYFHWAHIGCCYWKEEFKEIVHEDPIDFGIFNIEDFNKVCCLCLSKEGITHKCQSCDCTFHYECGRRRNCFFSKVLKLRTKTIKCLCFNHRPNNMIKHIEKNKFRKALEIAETCVSLKYFSELHSQIMQLESKWNANCARKLFSKVYNQIRDICKINITLQKNKDNSFKYIKGVDSIFNQLMKGGILDWNKISIRSYGIDFLKHMFYKRCYNPYQFSNYIISQSQCYSKKHTKKELKLVNTEEYSKGPFCIIKDKQKSIKRRKIKDLEYNLNSLSIVPENEYIFEKSNIELHQNREEMNLIADIDIPKFTQSDEIEQSYHQSDPEFESLKKELQEEDIGISNGNLIDELKPEITFCTCKTRNFCLYENNKNCKYGQHFHFECARQYADDFKSKFSIEHGNLFTCAGCYYDILEKKQLKRAKPENINKRMMKYNEKIYSHLKPQEKKVSPLQSICPESSGDNQIKPIIKDICYSEAILNNQILPKEYMEMRKTNLILEENVNILKEHNENSKIIEENIPEKSVNKILKYNPEKQQQKKLFNETLQKYNKKKRFGKISSNKICNMLNFAK